MSFHAPTGRGGSSKNLASAMVRSYKQRIDGTYKNDGDAARSLPHLISRESWRRRYTKWLAEHGVARVTVQRPASPTLRPGTNRRKKRKNLHEWKTSPDGHEWKSDHSSNTDGATTATEAGLSLSFPEKLNLILAAIALRNDNRWPLLKSVNVLRRSRDCVFVLSEAQRRLHAAWPAKKRHIRTNPVRPSPGAQMANVETAVQSIAANGQNPVSSETQEPLVVPPPLPPPPPTPLPPPPPPLPTSDAALGGERVTTRQTPTVQLRQLRLGYALASRKNSTSYSANSTRV